MADIFLTPAAAEHFGDSLIREFSLWADTQGIQRVAIVTPENIVPAEAQETQDIQDIMANNRQFSNFSNQIYRETLENTLAQFPDFPVQEYDLGATARDGVMGFNFSESRDLDGDGQRDTMLIVAPSLSETKEEYVARTWPQIPIENLPGTDRDWHAFVIGHEIGHGSQKDEERSTNKIIVWEVEAAQDAVYFFQSASAKGLVDLNVASSHASIRALESFYPRDNIRDTHHIGPGVQSPEEVGPVPVGDTDYFPFLLPLYDARRLVRRTAGENMTDDPADMMNAGSTALDDDPALMYEVTRRIFLQGGFDDNPVGKQYAYEFLTAAQKYAPTTFRIDDTGEIFEPPVFPESEDNTPSGHIDYAQDFRIP